MQNSFNAGNHDPCNSEFMTDDVDKLCQVMFDNDISETLESIEYPVVICHSPEDELGKLVYLYVRILFSSSTYFHISSHLFNC